MRKTYALAFAIIMFMQSCEVYKPVDFSNIKEGKTYELTLTNGQNIESKCENVDGETISIFINEKNMELPKSRIESAKRKKVSVLKLAGGIGIAAVGIGIILSNAKDDVIGQ